MMPLLLPVLTTAMRWSRLFGWRLAGGVPGTVLVVLAALTAASATAQDDGTPVPVDILAAQTAIIADVVAGRYADAEAAADRLAEALPEDADLERAVALSLKGWSQNAAGQYELSEAGYRDALKAAPDQNADAVMAAAWDGLPETLAPLPEDPAVAVAVLRDHYRAGLLFAAGRREEALTAAEQAFGAGGRTDAPQALPAQSPMRASLYGQYGFLLWVHRRLREVDPLMAEVEVIQRAAFGEDSPVLARTLVARAILARRAGKLQDAEAFYDRALAIQRAALPADDPEIAKTLGDRAVLLRSMDRLAEAEGAYLAALEVERTAFGDLSARVARTLSNLGILLRNMGRYAEAEDTLREALTAREASLGPTHPGIASTLIGLGVTMWSQGRYPEAERFLDRAVTIIGAAYGPTSPRIAAALNALATVYETEKEFAAAELTYRQALTALESRYPPDHPQVLVAKTNLASTLRFLERFEEAGRLAEEALFTARVAHGESHTRVGLMTNNLGGILRDQGDLDAADALYDTALRIARETFGPDHPDVAKVLHNKAKTARLRQDWTAADRLLARSIDILEPHLARYGTGRTRQAASERAAVRDVFLDRVEALEKRLATAQPDAASGDRKGLMRTAFRTLQQAGHIGISSAVAQMAARFGADEPDLAELIARRNVLLNRWQELDDTLIEAAGEPVADRDPIAEADLRAGLQAVRDLVAALDETLHRRFPAFADLIAPAPVELEEIQRVLEPDEAILVLGAGERDSFGYLVRPDRALLYAAEPNADELSDLVQSLRRGLSPVTVAEAGGLMAFDTEAAFALYRDLLDPAEAALQGVTRLFIVPDGALQSLPVGVLLTERPAEPFEDVTDFRDAPWLIRRYATTVIPSVSSLRVLREVARRSRAPEPFFGIGDPLLDGHPSDLRGAPACPDPNQAAGPALSDGGDEGGEIAVMAADAFVFEGEASEAEPVMAEPVMAEPVIEWADSPSSAGESTRGAGAPAILDWGAIPKRGVVDPNQIFRGAKGLADVCRVQNLAALPETADELAFMGETVAGGTSSPELLLQDRARETEVRRSPLERYRVIAFATHGLIAGELSGLTEPALVLTPPDQATPEDDGLLTASEIAELRLDADLVVLSACNTASSDGRPGAPGLSGLAKSFLFAGARSMFVSHWPVVSDSTASLTRSLFAGLRTEDPTAPPPPVDRLHRDAILAMIDHPEKPEWSHPLFWAPFVVIGAP